ncbi:hypothetical protein LTR62_003213 [Meristemomyces frigidus]|uniref:Uncharacterized protein n=1 Tax=Meristemomyces frigidus TaxID=1508187 RepID=A0AAN7TJH5_9PEZI|nr:hypothetical protein LTR62_003213 [Meristemomyces frigidus]
MAQEASIPPIARLANDMPPWLGKIVAPQRREAVLRAVIAGLDKPLISGTVNELALESAKQLLGADRQEVVPELHATAVWLRDSYPSRNRDSIQTVSSGHSNASSLWSSTSSSATGHSQWSNEAPPSASSATSLTSHQNAGFATNTTTPLTPGEQGTAAAGGRRPNQSTVQSPGKAQVSEEKCVCPCCRERVVKRPKDMKRHLLQSCAEVRKLRSQHGWLGCPYCRSLPTPSLDDYVTHMLRHHVHEQIVPENANVRLRNLTQQDPLAPTMMAALQSRGLRPDSWRDLEWPTQDVTWLIEVAETGNKDKGFFCAGNWYSAATFAEPLLDLASIAGQPLLPSFTPSPATYPESTHSPMLDVQQPNRTPAVTPSQEMTMVNQNYNMLGAGYKTNYNMLGAGYKTNYNPPPQLGPFDTTSLPMVDEINLPQGPSLAMNYTSRLTTQVNHNNYNQGHNQGGFDARSVRYPTS